MKQLKIAIMAMLAFFCITTVNAQTKKHHNAKHQHKMKYQCPMKCEGDTAYTTAGQCAGCELNLEKVTK